MSILKAEELTKNFGGTKALDGVNLELEKGERVGLIGPNGSGKTTLINHITGQIEGGGTTQFDGKDITNWSPHKIAKSGVLRTFQTPRAFEDLTIYENVLLPARYTGSFSNPEDKAMGILEALDLSERQSVKPPELNLMNTKKLELAKTLVLKPKVLFLDEVLAGLRREEWLELLDVINNVVDDKTVIVMVEHVMEAIMESSERIVVLSQGQNLTEGPPKEIASNDEVVKTYLGE